ncbi:hypoxanthine phosphoribosyltransferase [Phototrophicus methaneseepsis]|uniref:Hypoxanthine phosphoribosyltransferase n=1 Tax=Phototrophicus methaneseepsis TaxID=2710758 RepID=A0A7S8IBQ3_9CHLR|nr:hypoxanthine phosphoribosyltransferase [Phototrophicus methaneseepsis]QPC80715.1 hypoxanthine phosphoribosyltransferase [Phototrophicus methaneseepsis]
MAQNYQTFLKEVLIDENTLQARIVELGKQISADYADCDDLLLLCILKGGVMFLCDLARHIEVPHAMDFMAASSYGIGARATTGSVRIDMDITVPVKDRHVLIVEDIIDSGYTLSFVMDTLKVRNPASLKLCTLLNKASRREVDIMVDYVGFEIENKFVFGYGLDLDEKYRNLPFIGVVDEDALKNDA